MMACREWDPQACNSDTVFLVITGISLFEFKSGSTGTDEFIYLDHLEEHWQHASVYNTKENVSVQSPPTAFPGWNVNRPILMQFFSQVITASKISRKQ